MDHLNLSSSLELSGCSRLWIDGGSNLGGGVDDFFKGSFFHCAIRSPARLYGRPWHNASQRTKNAWMQPLAEPHRWCVRSFEANPRLMPMLKAKEAEHRAKGRNVRFIAGMLSTVTGAAVARTVYTYSKADGGSGASRFAFDRVHSGKPAARSSEVVHGAAFDIRDVVQHMIALNGKGVLSGGGIGLRLDVEGEELFIQEALSAGGKQSLLCNGLAYMFTEHHNLHVNLSHYGLPERGYNVIGDHIHSLMNAPSCTLKINWVCCCCF